MVLLLTMEAMAALRKCTWIVMLASLMLNACLWMTPPQIVNVETVKYVELKPTKPEFYHPAHNLKNFSTVPHEFIQGKLEAEHHDTFQVPNIVHYIWYADNQVEMRFDKALAILSAIKNLKPDAVYFHTNKPPTGKYFDMLKQYPVFKVIHRKPPKDVIERPTFRTTYSNYDRVKILIEQGGIYLDMDVMVVRPFDDVRKYGCTLGLENLVRTCAGVIVCAKEHPFLFVWLDTYYDDYEQYKHIWAFHSGNVPTVLIRRYPHLIHIEPMKFHRPGPHPDYLGSIWGNLTFPWEENYTVHTYIRLLGNATYPTEESIKTMNSTYGQIARQVFYGSKQLIQT